MGLTGIDFNILTTIERNENIASAKTSEGKAMPLHHVLLVITDLSQKNVIKIE